MSKRENRKRDVIFDIQHFICYNKHVNVILRQHVFHPLSSNLWRLYENDTAGKLLMPPCRAFQKLKRV
jgi:hypothetical protein